MLIFAAATQGFFMARNRIWETVALLLVTFLLLRPGFFLDLVRSPYQMTEPQNIHETIAAQPDNTKTSAYCRAASTIRAASLNVSWRRSWPLH